jgi:hypothetical protein
LPESLSLTELSIVEENTEANGAGWDIRPETASDDQRTAPRRDLEHLRQRHDRRRTVISFSGLTQDSSVLHVYVAKLALCPLFEGAELESLESLSEDDAQSPTSSFLVRVIVAQGYGQQGGPKLDHAAVTQYDGSRGAKQFGDAYEVLRIRNSIIVVATVARRWIFHALASVAT